MPMRSFKRNDRTAGAPKWALNIFLILVGVLLLLGAPVRSQQEEPKQTSTGKCPLTEQEVNTLIDLLNKLEQETKPTEFEFDYAEESDETLDAESRLTARCARELKKLRDAISDLPRSYYDYKQVTSTLHPRWYKLYEDRFTERKDTLAYQMEYVLKQVRPQDQLQQKKLREKYVEVEKRMNATALEVAKRRQKA
uniref:Uncharacterized protein n=1 Tax=Anopheles culicifacies TaxID=139723 RepID=A0A182M3R7_9DIPT